MWYFGATAIQTDTKLFPSSACFHPHFNGKPESRHQCRAKGLLQGSLVHTCLSLLCPLKTRNLVQALDFSERTSPLAYRCSWNYYRMIFYEHSHRSVSAMAINSSSSTILYLLGINWGIRKVGICHPLKVCAWEASIRHLMWKTLCSFEPPFWLESITSCDVKSACLKAQDVMWCDNFWRFSRHWFGPKKMASSDGFFLLSVSSRDALQLQLKTCTINLARTFYLPRKLPRGNLSASISWPMVATFISLQSRWAMFPCPPRDRKAPEE